MMCKVFIVDDERTQWHWLREVVYEQNPRNQVIPPTFVEPPLLGSSDLHAWLAAVMAPLENEVPDVAIVDLYLSEPERTSSPEGLAILKELSRRYPECALLLVTGKAQLSRIPPLPVPVRATISIASANANRFWQLRGALDDAGRCAAAAG